MMIGNLFYLETDTSGVGLGAALLQTQEGATCQKDMVPYSTILYPIAFASKGLTGAECMYSNIEREVLGMLHGLEKFHHYYFARDVYVITDHKPLVTIFKKDVATLSQGIQQILLKMHQHRVQNFIQTRDLKFLLQISLSHHNHKDNTGEAIQGMDIKVDAVQMMIDVPECMSMDQIQQFTVTG